MNKNSHNSKLEQMQKTNEYLEKICEMLDPVFLEKIKNNNKKSNRLSSLEFIHANMESLISKKG